MKKGHEFEEEMGEVYKRVWRANRERQYVSKYNLKKNRIK